MTTTDVVIVNIQFSAGIVLVNLNDAQMAWVMIYTMKRVQLWNRSVNKTRRTPSTYKLWHIEADAQLFPIRH